MPSSSAQNNGQSDAGSDTVRRDILPIPDVQHVGLTTYDAKDPDTTYPPITMLRPPAGAPNVLIVLIDDVGFGASSAFRRSVQHTGGRAKLAANGLKLNRFHTTALCSPTRQAMLTGRNHHSVGMGGITEIATSAPGYSSVRPKDKAPIAETLRLNGYSTSQFGKCHEVPVWEVSPVGPFQQWPTGSGFEHFYGFIGGEANQYYPGLYEGTNPVEPEKTPEEGYTLTEDLADRAITWVRQQKALTPDKPFFMYFAPGATHAPHHVPAKWSNNYKGKFDEGWDVLRERILPKQKELGVVPPDAELTARHAEIPAWDDMPAELKPVLARQMEIYAGFLEQTDHEVGRLIDALDDLGALEDTLVYYIEATKYNVIPIDDRSFERFNPDIAGRPQLITGTTQTLFSGMRLLENCVLNIKNKSHSVTATITVPDGGAKGVIVSQGGGVGGWCLYAHEGKLKYCYNFFGTRVLLRYR